jgi:excisionase family DNA binding protein
VPTRGGRRYRVERLLLTMSEAAETIGLGRSKLYELVASGEIESVRIGKARRVPVEAVESFVRRLRLEHAVSEPGSLGTTKPATRASV